MNREQAEQLTVWNQHNVGDAGFRSEQRYSVFYRIDDRFTRPSPLFYVPIVRGTRGIDAVRAVALTHSQADSVEFHRPGKSTLYFWHNDLEAMRTNDPDIG